MPQRRDAREAIYEPPDRSLWPLALVRDGGGGEQPAPRDVRHLLFIKDSAQRDHAYLRLRPRVDMNECRENSKCTDPLLLEFTKRSTNAHLWSGLTGWYFPAKMSGFFPEG